MKKKKKKSLTCVSLWEEKSCTGFEKNFLEEYIKPRWCLLCTLVHKGHHIPCHLISSISLSIFFQLVIYHRILSNSLSALALPFSILCLTSTTRPQPSFRCRQPSHYQYEEYNAIFFFVFACLLLITTQ